MAAAALPVATGLRGPEQIQVAIPDILDSVDAWIFSAEGRLLFRYHSSIEAEYVMRL